MSVIVEQARDNAREEELRAELDAYMKQVMALQARLLEAQARLAEAQEQSAKALMDSNLYEELLKEARRERDSLRVQSLNDDLSRKEAEEQRHEAELEARREAMARRRAEEDRHEAEIQREKYKADLEAEAAKSADLKKQLQEAQEETGKYKPFLFGLYIKRGK